GNPAVLFHPCTKRWESRPLLVFLVPSERVQCAGAALYEPTCQIRAGVHDVQDEVNSLKLLLCCFGVLQLSRCVNQRFEGVVGEPPRTLIIVEESVVILKDIPTVLF